MSVYFKMPPDSFGKRDIKMDPKRNALFEVKLLSRDKVIHIHRKIHMLMFHYDAICDCKHRLTKANDSR